MGQKSNGTQTQNQTQTSAPDPLTDQWRQQVFNMGSGMVGQPTPNYQVAPMSGATQAGLQGAQQYAQGGVPGLGQAFGANQQHMTGWNPAMPMAQGVAQGALSNNPWASSFSQYGQDVNPGLRSLFDQGATQISDAVNGAMARAGRFGSPGAHTGTMTREIGNLWDRIYTPAWEAERNRGLTAQQTGASLWDAGANRALTGVGMVGDLYNTGVGQSQNAIAALPGLFATGAMPYQMMTDVGGAYDAQAQAENDAAYQNQNAPWQRLMEYSAMMSGMPVFGTQTTTGTAKNSQSGTGFGFSWGPFRIGA